MWRRRLRVWGHTVKASSLDRLVCLLLHKARMMGQPERELLKRLVSPGMQVADIGANLGLYTLLLAELTGSTGAVHSFEPEPELFRALRSNCRRNDMSQVMPYNCAAGAEPGEVTFYRSLFNSGDNRLGDLGWTGQALRVRQVRLDDVLIGQRLHFVKMDVQGYEMHVLRGMERLIECSPELMILFEFWPRGLRAAGTRPEDLPRYLQQRGFRMYHHVEGRLQPITAFAQLAEKLPGLAHADLLASRQPLPAALERGEN